MTSGLTIGMFVGGAGKRMGGVAKGLLRAPDGTETLIERLLRLCARAAPDAKLYFVGDSSAYARFGVSALSDDPVGIGPIGGLRSLLQRAEREGSCAALALASDLPFLDERVISALIAPLALAARVPFVAQRLQPLSALYAPAPTLTAVNRSLELGKHALMHVLELLGPGVERIEFDAAGASALRDWDTPEDVRG